MAKRFVVPFASTGDKTVTPDATDPGGAISYSQGWPVAYQLLDTDPSYRPVGRQEMNGVLYDVTGAISELQNHGLPSWVAVGGLVPPYVVGALVRHVDKNWRSTIANNSGTPGAGGSGWVELDTQTGKFLGLRVINVTGTYTPTPGMSTCVVEIVGGGGGSAHVQATGAAQFATTGGGGAGMYAKLLLTAAQIGASVSCVIGAGGAGASAGGTPTVSASGGATLFGGLATVGGGGRSLAGVISSGTYLTPPGIGGTSFSGTGTPIYTKAGENGTWGTYSTGSGQLGGNGGSSPLGTGGPGSGIGIPAVQGLGYGSGGGASSLGPSSASIGGAPGAQGVILVWEYA